MEYVIGGICVLVAITIIGHGLWLLVTLPFRDASSTPPGRASDLLRPGESRRCPRCSLPLVAQTCNVCHWPTPAGLRPPDARQTLATLHAQLEQLQRLGAIDTRAGEQLAAVLAAERVRLDTAVPVRAAAEAVILADAVEEPPVAAAERSTEQVPSPPADFEKLRERLRLPPESTPGQRVAAYAASQQVAPAVAFVPAAPRRSWTDWLAGFMEERNIRWGELVGGLLIVCGSIALVISFWSEIESRPWLKFSLFNGVTAAIFGAGFYSEYRWRLLTTSRGLLTIGCLLVPLNFLAIAALSSAPGTGGLLTVVGEFVSAGLFAALVFFAGRVLIGRDALPLAVGLLVPSLAQLLVRRFVLPGAELPTLVALAAVPTLCYLAVNFWHLRKFAAELMPDERQINGLLRFLGLTAFAVVLPLALLLYRTGHPIDTLRQMPALAGLLGFVPLSAGLLLWQKLAGRSLVGLRTAGTSVAVMGALVTLSGLVIGWPEPIALLPAAVLEFAIFTFIAWRFALPAAHLLAAPCLALAYLLGAHLLGGHVTWSSMSSRSLATVLVSGDSGVLLAPLVLAYLGATFVALRRGTEAFRALRGAALGLMAVSVALVTWFGFGERGVPLGTGWVYLLYAACWLAVAARVRHVAPGWIGFALLLAAVWQELVFRFAPQLGLAHPVAAGLLFYASLSALLGSATRIRGLVRGESPLPEIAWQASLGASALGAAVLVALMPTTTVDWQAAHWGWVAVLWGVSALALGWLPLGAMFQTALAVAAMLAAVIPLSNRPWFNASPRPWLDPWTLQTVGLAWIGLNFGWALLRVIYRPAAEMGTDSWPARVQRLLASPWMSVDRILTGALVALLLLLGTYVVLPGVLMEISPASDPRAFDVARWQPFGIPYEHAGQWGSWSLLGGLLVLLTTILRQRASHGWLYAAILVVACSCPLWAFRFEGERATASSLAWLSTLFLLATSAAVWCRGPVARFASRFGWPTFSGDARAAQESTLLVLLLGLAAPLGLAVAVASQAMTRTSHLGVPLAEATFYLIAAVATVTVGASLWVRAQAVEENSPAGRRPDWPGASGALVILLGLAPLLALLLHHVAVAIATSPIQGPLPQSIFGRIGASATYSGPLVLIAIALFGYALRQRLGVFGLSANLALCGAATTAYLLGNGVAVSEIGTWIRVAQLNAVVSAAVTLAWIAVAAWDARREGRYGLTASGTYFGMQTLLAPVALSLPLTWAWAHLVRFPVRIHERVVPLEIADAWGIASLALVAVAVWAAAEATHRRLSKLAASALLVSLAIVSAGIAARWDSGDWLAYHTLYVAHGAIACLLLVAAWRETRLARGEFDTSNVVTAAPLGAMWPFIQLVLLLALALRQFNDYRWWAAGGFAVAGLFLLPALAWIYQRRRYLYLAAPLVNLAGILAADELNWLSNGNEFVYWNVLLLALPVPAWLAIERWSIGLRTFKPHFNLSPAHRVATRAAVVLVALAVGFGLAGDATGSSLALPLLAVNWLALAAAGIAALACLYDDDARDPVGLVYVLGLVACGMLLDGFNLSPQWLLWTGTMVLAAYALATSYLWSRRHGLQEIAESLGISRGKDHELAGLDWLVPSTSLLILAVVGMAFVIELTNQRTDLRILASQAALIQVMSLGLLARGDRRGVLQLAALSLGAVGAVYFGWAWLDPATSFTLLHALVVVAAAIAGVASFYGLVLSKVLSETSEWLAAAQRLMPALAVASGIAIAATLGLEVFQFANDGAVAIAWPAIVVVGVTLAALALALLAAAVLPGRDPLGLSERGRTAYVYAAEILLALLFVHVRVTCPWLFQGFFQQFWPLIVMAIAYLGVGFAELFRRRQQHVLSEPLENTGALLPVLPVIGYWAVDSRVDYSLLLLCVGVLYAGLSIARRSFGFGVLAALAANGGLWFLLNRQDGWGFLTHPQVWLIPPALCVLAAAYLNRQQLSDAQMTAIRYVSSMAIYISSTADIFLNGVAENLWLPMVLAAFAILGILAGILLRVRAFLFLGTGFLALAMFTIIWYAAVDRHQTWIWYASVVIAGILILVLFGLFEKKRQELMDVVERLKQWEA